MVNSLYHTGNAFSSSGQKVVHFQDSRQVMSKDRVETHDSQKMDGEYLIDMKSEEHIVDQNFRVGSNAAVLQQNHAIASKFENNSKTLNGKQKNFFLIDNGGDMAPITFLDNGKRKADSKILMT